MNIHTQFLTFNGPVGAIEALLDVPAADQIAEPHGTAVIAHPHPLYGGTMNNKVVQTLARACVQSGWRAVRFNFRGIGASAGAYDEGRGEADDMRAVIEQAVPAGQPLVVGGFSFGAFVAAQVLADLPHTRPLASTVLVGVAASRFAVPALLPEQRPLTLVVHGEQDDTVPLGAVMDWARPQSLPVTVVPGVEHFFHGQLPLLKALVARHVRAASHDQ